MSDQTEELKDLIRQHREALVTTLSTDADKYLEEMATDLAVATAEGDTEGIEEIRQQAVARAGAYQVQVNDAAWGLLAGALKIGVAALA